MRSEMFKRTSDAFSGRKSRVALHRQLGALLCGKLNGNQPSARQDSQGGHWCVVVTALLASWTAFAGAVAAPYQATIGADGVQRVDIVGGSYFFQPDHVVALAGRPLEITVRVEPGIIPHRFVLEAESGKPLADISLEKEAKTLRFNLPAGKYVFHCPNRLLLFKSHRERGMAGVLEVRE